MSGFRRRRRGIELTLSADERGVVRDLVGQLYELLEPPPVADPLEALVGLRSQALPTPTDPAVARLLPDAYREDPAASAEHRRRTEDDLRNGKRDAARRVLDLLPSAGGRGVVADEDAHIWLAVLTDLRLVLGARLELRTDSDADRLARTAPGDPRAPVVAVYQFLTVLQDQLVHALSR